uniref:Androgen-induced gene 1 protein-like n=1 Tax=Saccoglossus kowalevskii TaxID=10224 RepID=A0ABM0MZV4_SACKO|nr:PREDICTED: androgen-induced gene 1 protein-like [Saccoglossus kowalevskii]
MASEYIFRFLSHTSIFVIYAFGIYYDMTILADDMMRAVGPRSFGGNAKFLTIWNMNFQTFYFGLCILTDLVLSCNKRSKFGRRLCRFRDWFLAAIAFPIGMLVVLMFWLIYAVDRELVFPEWLDKIFPSWLNHVMHTTVIPFLFVDMYLVQHNYPSRKSGIFGTFVVGLTYLAWFKKLYKYWRGNGESGLKYDYIYLLWYCWHCHS